MQKAEVILSLLSQKGKNDEHYVYRRLYRNLYNPDFYLNAYAKMLNKPSNFTDRVNCQAMDGFHTAMIDEIIQEMKTETYYPKPVRRIHSSKKVENVRLQGILGLKDQLVQEVVRRILEAIYEPIFLDTSHGDRPNRTCHTALHMIKLTCRETNWVIDGNIAGFYDNIDHQILIHLLKKKIDDGRFIELIRRFLKAGYLKFKPIDSSFMGVSQDGMIRSILGNIYLHELDQFMDGIMAVCTKRNLQNAYPTVQLTCSRQTFALRGDQKSEKEPFWQNQMVRTDSVAENNIRVNYIRYLEHFLVFVSGSKKQSVQIRDQIQDFLKDKLNLELNSQMTRITNLKDQKVQFLGYQIAKKRRNYPHNRNCEKKHSANEIELLVPHAVIQEKIKPFCKNGKAVHHKTRMNWSLLDMLTQYNAEIRELYDYYCLAADVSTKIGKFRYYHYLSLLKTVARKEKSSVKKVLNKYGVHEDKGTRKIFGVQYQTKDGQVKVVTYFNESLKKRNYPLPTMQHESLSIHSGVK